MYNIMCFRYLSHFPPEEEVALQASNSFELEKLYDLLDTTSDYFEKNDLDVDDTKNIINMQEVIKSLTNEAVSSYNERWTQMSYLWLDEVVPARVIGTNVRLLSINGNLGSNKEELDRIANACVRALKGRNVYNDKFDDLVYLIFIDIIPKDTPTFVAFPEDYDDSFYEDDEDY